MSDETTKPNGSSNKPKVNVEYTSEDVSKMGKFNFELGYMFFEPEYDRELNLGDMMNNKATKKNTKIKTSKTLIVSFSHFIDAIANGISTRVRGKAKSKDVSKSKTSNENRQEKGKNVEK